MYIGHLRVHASSSDGMLLGKKMIQMFVKAIQQILAHYPLSALSVLLSRQMVLDEASRIYHGADFQIDEPMLPDACLTHCMAPAPSGPLGPLSPAPPLKSPPPPRKSQSSLLGRPSPSSAAQAPICPHSSQAK